MENKDASANSVNTKEATKLKHSHSTPLNRKKETFNPLLFRNSRSNIYRDARDEDSNEQNQQPQTNLQPIADSNEWKINNIEEFPTHFDVQRTHCIVHDISANEVATKISSFLKDAADSILYDNDNAIAHVEMEHGLRLLIRLFKTLRHDGGDDKDKDQGQNQDGSDSCKEGGVLVEITRREGCSAKFHSVARKILAAAQGMEGDELKNLEENTLTPKPLKVSSELRQEFLKQVKINP